MSSGRGRRRGRSARVRPLWRLLFHDSTVPCFNRIAAEVKSGVRRNRHPVLRGPLRRAAAARFDQQLWCWSRDIDRPDGNVLLGLGMCRHVCPPRVAGCSAYTGRTRGGGEVWLWGFGLLYSAPNRSGVFLRRYRFDPHFVASPPILPPYVVTDLPRHDRPRTAGQRAATASLLRAAAG